MNRSALAGTLLALTLLLAPLPSFAASKPTFLGPIVPAECHCDNQTIQGDGASGTVTTAPDYGCVLQVIQNIINFGITLSILLSTIYLVITGFAFMTSGGSSEARSKAKTRFANVFIGLVVLLCAWLIVDFVMKTVYDAGKFGPWNSILAGAPDQSDRCIVARQPSAITSGTVGIVTGVTPGTSVPSSGGSGSCSAIPDSQLVPIDSGGHKLTPDAAQRFAAMKAAAAKDGITLSVSSAYRSPDQQLQAWNNNGCQLVNGKAVCATRTAAIPCSLGGGGSNHTRGTAVDITLNGNVYAWLTKNAAQFGFYNKLPNDLPHWSDTGT